MKYLFCFIFPFNFLFAQDTRYDIESHNYEAVPLRTGIDGTILFKVYSFGRNSDQAIQNSKADALKVVLFRGVQNSDLVNPIVGGAILDELQKQFFITFFKSNKYLDFVSIANDGSILGEDRIKIKGKYKIGVIVSVNKKLLRSYLEETGIIKKLNDGF